MIVYFEGVARTLQRCLTRLRELALALSGLSWAEVKAMAVQLGMDFPALSQIEQQTSEFSDRLHATMDAWLKTDPHASWKAAVRALRAINKNVLAMELEEKYAPTLPAPPAPGKMGEMESRCRQYSMGCRTWYSYMGLHLNWQYVFH